MTAPSFQEIALSCTCGHEWTGHLPVDVSVKLWSAHVKATRCQECGAGSKKIMFGQKPKELPVETDRPIAERLRAWRSGADIGMSSMTIAAVMSGSNLGICRAEYPHDPDDLGRCLRLLRLIPEWRGNMMKMAGLGYVWAELVRRWDELEQTMIDEVGLFWEKARRAPRTYDLLQECELVGLEADPAIIVRKRDDGVLIGWEAV